MIKLFGLLGEISEDELEFLIDELEEEWADDQDYFLNKPMIDLLETKGAQPALLALLRAAVGDRDGLEFVWVDTEEELGDDDV